MAAWGSYVAVADRLRALIASGALAAGVMLPSEASLARQNSVSRGTARSALRVLADEGLIEVVPGVGRRVAGAVERRPPATAWERLALHLRQCLEAGQYEA